jgi:uncharacterized protein YndB with AHSA1/START domain
METRALKKSVIINAYAADIWKTITDPDSIKKFLFDTSVETDWKVGSPITYSGMWKGKEYRDKGKITKFEKEKTFEHTHWSSLSGTTDDPKNYFNVRYELEEKENNETVLTVTQRGEMSQDAFDHSSSNWDVVLQKIKELVEKEVSANQVVS